MKKLGIIITIISVAAIITYLVIENEYRKETARQMKAIEDMGDRYDKMYDTQIKITKAFEK